MDNKEISKAIEILTKALSTDSGYYTAWQANIAMAVYAKIVLSSLDTQSIHQACNEGAKSFLNLLIETKNI